MPPNARPSNSPTATPLQPGTSPSTPDRQAQEEGFLKEEDRVVMNGDHLIHAAKREALELADGYAPPTRDKSIYAAGTVIRGALEVGAIRPTDRKSVV